MKVQDVWLADREREDKFVHLVPVHSITNHFVGLSQSNPIAIYTFPYDETREATPVDEQCAARQTGITARYLAGLEVPPHDHEFYEITLVREGKAVHHTDWGDVEVGAGSVMVVPPGLVHAFTELDKLVVTNIYYQSEWLSENLRTLLKQEGLVPLFLAADLFSSPVFKRIHAFALDEVRLGCCVRELRDICRAQRQSSTVSILAHICFLKILTIMSEAYCLQEGSVGVLPFRPETWALLEEMEDALLSGRLFVFREAAARLGLSTRHLSLVFLRDVGLRPSSYYQRRRSQHAARLLLRSNVTITEVAHFLGYADSAHFCNQFKRIYGLSPKMYRRHFGT
jgi:AraC-like DNA-binding protein/mannose-6-phosphate isomerase-like protein (cupin superfamily)